jgi:hypothetical protein
MGTMSKCCEQVWYTRVVKAGLGDARAWEPRECGTGGEWVESAMWRPSRGWTGEEVVLATAEEVPP